MRPIAELMSEAIDLADATFLELQKRLADAPLDEPLQAAVSEALKECFVTRDARIQQLAKGNLYLLEQSAIDEQILKQQLLSAEAEVTRLTRWKDSVNREIAALAENYEKQIAENERLVRELEKSRELAAAFQKERDRCESKWFEAKEECDALRADLARVSEDLRASRARRASPRTRHHPRLCGPSGLPCGHLDESRRLAHGGSVRRTPRADQGPRCMS